MKEKSKVIRQLADEKSKIPRKNLIRHIFFILFICLFLFIASGSVAEEDSTKSAKNVSPTPVNNEKVQELKEKLATKVAEIRENQKRGFYGEISSLAKTTFTLATTNGEIRVRFDTNTQVFDISGSKKSEKTTTDLKNTQTASVLGLYEPDDKTVTAKVLLLHALPRYIQGTISALDKAGANVSLKTDKGETLTVDYERTTKADELSTSGKLAKSGFSRLAIGDKLLAWATPAADDVNNFSFQRLFRIPENVLGTANKKSEEPGNLEASPSSTPKNSPRATPKTSPRQQPKSTSQPTPEN